MENKELMGAILSLENLLRAYKRVVQNGGAAGVDRVETGELASYLREHWPRVRSELLEGRYCHIKRALFHEPPCTRSVRTVV